jgi:hypothetical protein
MRSYERFRLFQHLYCEIDLKSQVQYWLKLSSNTLEYIKRVKRTFGPGHYMYSKTGAYETSIPRLISNLISILSSTVSVKSHRRSYQAISKQRR